MSCRLKDQEIRKITVPVSSGQEVNTSTCWTENRVFWIRNPNNGSVAPELWTGRFDTGESTRLSASQLQGVLFQESHYIRWQEGFGTDAKLCVLDSDTMKQQIFAVNSNMMTQYESQRLIYGDTLLLPESQKIGELPVFSAIGLKSGSRKSVHLAGFFLTGVLCGERSLVYFDGAQLRIHDLETGQDAIFAAVPGANRRDFRLVPCGENFLMDDLQTNYQVIVFSLKKPHPKVVSAAV